MRNKVLTSLLLLVGSALLVFTSFSRAWYVAPVAIPRLDTDHGIAWIGLFGETRCVNQGWHDSPTRCLKSELNGTSLQSYGLITLCLSLVLAAVGLGLGVLVWRSGRFAPFSAGIFVGVGLAVVTLLMGILFGHELTHQECRGRIITMGYAFPLFVAGTLLVAAGAASLWRPGPTRERERGTVQRSS